MRRLLDRSGGFLLGLLAVSTVATVIAQEAAMFNRGLTINQGNFTTTRGASILTPGVFINRWNQQINTDTDVTYTAHHVRFGLVTRDLLTSNRTDTLPTAANLVSEMDGAIVGSSFFFMVMNEDSAQTVTVNGASTGVTYSGSCSTALAADESMAILILFTNVTSGSEAYIATCLQN